MSFYYGAPQQMAQAGPSGYYQQPQGYAMPPMQSPQQPPHMMQQRQNHFNYGPPPQPQAQFMPQHQPQPQLMPQQQPYWSPQPMQMISQPSPPPQMMMQPVVQAAPMPPPQPLQPNLNDPNVFRTYFRSGLQSLTHNSRQIIQDLTMLANEFSLRMSGIIADELEGHIRNAPPQYKLPPLYLLDSIAKNIGPPYVTLFGRFLERLFLLNYREVDPTTKVKMEELLGTWRTGGPNGGVLYGDRLQRNIEDSLFGRGGHGGGIGGMGKGVMDSPHFVSGVHQKPSSAPPHEIAALMEEIRRVLGIRRAKAFREPADRSNAASVEALQKLEKLVSTAGVSSEQGYQIRQQLVALAPPGSSEDSQQTSSTFLDSLNTMDPSTISALLSAQPAGSLTSRPISSDLSMNNISNGGYDNVDLSNVSSALRSLDPNLLASLGAAVGAVTPKAREPKEVAYEQKLFTSYAHDTGHVGLTASAINKPREGAHELLYNEMSLQCTQCAARWLDTLRCRKVFQKHMDRHFRTNNRLMSATRAQSRSWLSVEEDWLGSPEEEAEDPAKEEEAERAAEIARSIIKAPSDPIRASKPCPICKEKFKQQWNEGEEDFVWQDAKEVDGVIYHASCYLETQKARLNSKLMKAEGSTPSYSDSTPASRESTPQLNISPHKQLASPSAGHSTLAQSPMVAESPSPSASPLESLGETADSKVDQANAADIQQMSPPQNGTQLLSAAQSSLDASPQNISDSAVEVDINVPETHQEALQVLHEDLPVGEASAPAVVFDSNLLQAFADIISKGDSLSSEFSVKAEEDDAEDKPAYVRSKRSLEEVSSTPQNLQEGESEVELGDVPHLKRIKQEEPEDIPAL